MRRFWAVCTTAVLAGSLSVAGFGAVAASADTTDTTATTSSAVSTDAPTADPTATAAPVAAPAPADTTAAPAVAAALTVTTDGTNLPASTSYVVNAWKLGPLSTPKSYDASTINSTNAFNDQQKEFKESAPASSVNLNALDSQLAAGACYQIDGYVVGDTTTNLIVGGVLNSPNHPAEQLATGASGVSGNPWKFVCVPPAPVTCSALGAQYTESGDHVPATVPDGYDFRSYHDGHATGLLFPVNTNAQAVGTITYTDENVVGNGIFFRFVFNLSADGGPAYASFSVSPSTTINQSSVANVGSNANLLGKTIAQVAVAYPDNKIVAEGFQTGSSYPGNGSSTSDGATLTGFTDSTSAACGASFNHHHTVVACTSQTTLPVATEANPEGWGDLLNGTWTASGIQLTATSSEEAYAYKDFTGVPFTHIGDLSTVADNVTGTFGVILQDSTGQSIHYDADGTYWTVHAGLFDASTLNGGIYSTKDLNAHLISDPSITEVAVWVNPGGSLLLKSQNYDCLTQPFFAAATPSIPTTVKTGDAPINPAMPAGLALLAVAMFLFGSAAIRKARSI